MNHRTRLERLEGRRGDVRWCRCGFDRDRCQAETQAAMETGEPTPSECDRCGGTRISVQYYDASDGNLWRGLHGRSA